MAAALTDMHTADEAEDVLAFVAADRRFHFALLAPGCGPQLLSVLTSLWDRSDHYRAAFLSEAAHRHGNHDEHAAILAAASAHDAATLITLLDAHRLAALHAT